MTQREKLEQASKLAIYYASKTLPLDIQLLELFLKQKDWVSSSSSLEEIQSLKTILRAIINKIDIIEECHAASRE